MDQVWEHRTDKYSNVIMDTHIGTEREERVKMEFAKHNAYNKPHKINDLYLDSQVVRNISLHQKLAPYLTELLGYKIHIFYKKQCNFFMGYLQLLGR